MQPCTKGSMANCKVVQQVHRPQLLAHSQSIKIDMPQCYITFCGSENMQREQKLILIKVVRIDACQGT